MRSVLAGLLWGVIILRPQALVAKQAGSRQCRVSVTCGPEAGSEVRGRISLRIRLLAVEGAFLFVAPVVYRPCYAVAALCFLVCCFHLSFICTKHNASPSRPSCILHLAFDPPRRASTMQDARGSAHAYVPCTCMVRVSGGSLADQGA
jgi:hypothetical protein